MMHWAGNGVLCFSELIPLLGAVCFLFGRFLRGGCEAALCSIRMFGIAIPFVWKGRVGRKRWNEHGVG
jgi:hypothetical protein